MSERNRQPAAHQLQNVFVFLLLAIFAVSAILLTALSAQVYRDTVDVSNRNNAARVAAAVVRGAAQSEDSGTASVRTEDGIPVLVFAGDYDGEIYLRRLWCADGRLRESFTSAEYPFEKDMGESLTEMVSFEPRIENDMLTVRVVTPESGEQTIRAYLRAGGSME